MKIYYTTKNNTQKITLHKYFWYNKEFLLLITFPNIFLEPLEHPFPLFHSFLMTLLFILI
jgi:hypothetical protein